MASHDLSKPLGCYSQMMPFIGMDNMANQIVNSRLIPYEAYYSSLAQWRKAGNILLTASSILSVLQPYITSQLSNNSIVVNAVEFASYVAIISCYGTNVVSEVFLYPATARLRRRGFIDNSLGARLLTGSTQGYYTNDSIEPGLYKMSVNCYENCYFTYNIANDMTPRVAAKNIVFFAVFLALAYTGLQGNIVGLPIVQILFSTLFITELIYHLAFVARLKNLLERYGEYFNDTLHVQQKRSDPQYSILFLLEYETALAFNKAPLSDKTYQRLNAKLSGEWDSIKQRYDIH